MSISKCSKCVGSPRELLSVVCNSCSTVNAATNYFSSEKDLEGLKDEFKSIHKKMDVINANLGQLMSALKLLYKQIDEMDK